MPKNQTKDDCASLSIAHENLLINTDLMVEDTHFNDNIIHPKDLGWKSVTTNYSDLISSGCMEFIGINIGLIINPETKETSTSGSKTITSPIVGTFYRRPAPDKDPYVKVGDVIDAGQIVCIVEAMKMMNEIKSEFSGKIVSIEVEDGEPVQFSQDLITLE